MSSCSSGLRSSKRPWLFSSTDEVERERVIQQLMDEMGFNRDLAKICAGTNVGLDLLRLKQEGIKISEGDPLLIIAVDVNVHDSVHYFENGNYGLPEGSPGRLVWPGGVAVDAGGEMPADVVAGRPHAFGRLIAAQPGMRDVSGGRPHVFGRFIAVQPKVHEISAGYLNIFHVPNLDVLLTLHGVVQSTVQFRRNGPVMANALKSSSTTRSSSHFGFHEWSAWIVPTLQSDGLSPKRSLLQTETVVGAERSSDQGSACGGGRTERTYRKTRICVPRSNRTPSYFGGLVNMYREA